MAVVSASGAAGEEGGKWQLSGSRQIHGPNPVCPQVPASRVTPRVPCHLPAHGRSPISPSSSSSASMRVRETPAISSAVMKEPTRARAMRTPRLSARVKGGHERGGVAGRVLRSRELRGAPGCPQTHPAHARQRRPRCPAPGRTARPGCSPPAPRKHLRGSERSEPLALDVPGVPGDRRGAHRGSGADARRWQGLSCAPASSPPPPPPASPGEGAGDREARPGGQGEEQGRGDAAHLHPADTSLAVDPCRDRAVSPHADTEGHAAPRAHQRPGTGGRRGGSSSPSPSSISSSASWKVGLEPGTLHGDRLSPRVPAGGGEKEGCVPDFGAGGRHADSHTGRQERHRAPATLPARGVPSSG